ncbi:zinc metalloprotease [Thermococcus henrietii]|uniref:hypothetical protein n=1 Tax=Thermococcus henrietii TaxID=2016361 RepID=UPI000C08D592|nr:hypothetical protein [Thermococcus henrietii]
MDMVEMVHLTVAYFLILGMLSWTSLSSAEFYAIPLLTAFALYELGHKYVGNKFGYAGGYRLSPTVIVVSILLYLATLGSAIFFAPGVFEVAPKVDGTTWKPHYDVGEVGKIALAGPLANLAFATVFFVLAFFNSSMEIAAVYGINTLMGLCNLLPFRFFDGGKVLSWSKRVYALVVAYGLALFLIAWL